MWCSYYMVLIHDINSKTEVSQIGDISGKHREENEDVKKSESTAKSVKEDDIVPDLNYSDPAKWPYCCSDNLRQLIIQHGPQQVVSQDSKTRKFSSIHY